jgi:hypothetical protein
MVALQKMQRTFQRKTETTAFRAPKRRRIFNRRLPCRYVVYKPFPKIATPNACRRLRKRCAVHRLLLALFVANKKKKLIFSS